MLGRTAFSLIPRSAARFASTDAAPAAAVLKLNFSLPHQTVYKGKAVYSVILPGLEGEYGVTSNHVPYVAQLKPGLLKILHEEGTSDPEKFFIAGGYAFTHPDSTTDVVCPEAVKLDDVDASAVQKNFEAAKSKFSSAPSGSMEQASAQIEMEVNKELGMALGMNLS